MLEFKVVNMSCGHCQLKIDSLLNEEGYDVEKIDMNRNIVRVQAKLKDKQHIAKRLDQIGYLVDQGSFKELTSHLIESSKIHDEKTLDSVLSYLVSNDYLIEDINDDLSIAIICSEKELKEINNHVKQL